VKSQVDRSNLANAIEQAMPPRRSIKWRKRIEAIRDEWRLINYVFKAKISGKLRNGRRTIDLHAAKRYLFQSNLGLRKVGTIGRFWVKSGGKSNIWKDVKKVEQRIADGLASRKVRTAIANAVDMFGESVSRKRIERSMAYWSTHPTIDAWLQPTAVD
jgi:hypothetical protein